MLLVDMEDQAGLYQVLWSGAVLRHGRVRRDRRGLMLVVGSETESLAD